MFDILESPTKSLFAYLNSFLLVFPRQTEIKELFEDFFAFI